ncbi:MAG: patatin-like phospholipase family protein [Pseudomonadota bacterium]
MKIAGGHRALPPAGHAPALPLYAAPPIPANPRPQPAHVRPKRAGQIARPHPPRRTTGARHPGKAPPIATAREPDDPPPRPPPHPRPPRPRDERRALVSRAALPAGPGTSFAIGAPLPAPNRPAASAPAILALSGGGPDGAFGAGYLSGAMANGMPPPDIVTGVSIGALIAPFALTGQHSELEALFTSGALTPLGAGLNPGAALLGGTLSDGRSLETLVATWITDDLITRVAAAHRRGQRLYVATTDLDAMAPVAWDITRLAARGTPESRALIRRIIVASASVPGVFPPVPLHHGETRLHVDGGVTLPVYIPDLPRGLPARQTTVIINNALGQDPPLARISGLAAAQRGFSTLIRAQTRTLIENARLKSRARFRVISLPEDIPAAALQDFDIAKMRRAFAAGQRAAQLPPARHAKN